MDGVFCYEERGIIGRVGFLGVCFSDFLVDGWGFVVGVFYLYYFLNRFR